MMERGIGDMLGRIADLERQVERLSTIETPGGGVEYLYKRVLLGSSLAPIDFVQIPQTGRSLILKWRAHGDLGGFSANNLFMRLSSNATSTPTPDTGASYCYTYNYENNGAATVGASILAAFGYVGIVGGAASGNTDYFSSGRLEIGDYTHASHIKSWQSLFHHQGTTATSTTNGGMITGDWHGGAINQVRFYPQSGGQFIAGSIFELWIA